MMPNDNHLEQFSLILNTQHAKYLHITQETVDSSVPGGAKLAHLEHRPPPEGHKTRVSVPGDCPERQDEWRD